VDYPIGHRKRRVEACRCLVKKFETSVAAHFGAKQTESDQESIRRSVRARGDAGSDFMAKLVSAS